MKIIFDRSAFHKESFNLLKDSQFLQLTGAGKIQVFHTTVFLDETIRMAKAKKKGAKDELKRQWAFLMQICNGGWFKPLLVGKPPKLNSVCYDEFEGKNAGSNWPLVSDKMRKGTEQKVSKFLQGTGSLTELDNSKAVHDQNEQVKAVLRSAFVELRNKNILPKNTTLEDYIKVNVYDFGEHLMRLFPDLDQREAKLDAWRADINRFPHFSAYVESHVYAWYDAERNQNSKLDRNWIGDAEYLCFLIDVDAIVTSDAKFMRRAFEALWQPRGKRIFTPEEFVDFLHRSAAPL